MGWPSFGRHGVSYRSQRMDKSTTEEMLNGLTDNKIGTCILESLQVVDMGKWKTLMRS